MYLKAQPLIHIIDGATSDNIYVPFRSTRTHTHTHFHLTALTILFAVVVLLLRLFGIAINGFLLFQNFNKTFSFAYRKLVSEFTIEYNTNLALGSKIIYIYMYPLLYFYRPYL